MSSWGNNDNAANAPYWAVNSTIVNAVGVKASAAAPTAANVALLYGNTTTDVYTTGETIGLFGVDAQEADVNGNGTVHTGWVLKTTGSGGRAGRIQQEVLIALSEMKSDGDAQQYPNVSITLTGPSGATVVANTSNANSATFTVSPALVGNTSATLSYQWQVNSNTGSLGWTSVANNTPTATEYVGGTTPTLRVVPFNATANQYVLRAVVTAADQGVVATSSNATVTIITP
jgi:hypothetical protein